MTNAVQRVDWPRIKAKLGAAYAAPFLFIIPDAGRHMLLANFDRLFWDATFKVPGYDPISDDDRKAIVHLTYDALLGDEQVSEIADAIRYLADTLEINVTVDNSNTNNNEATGGSGSNCCTELPQNEGDELVPLNPNDPLGEIPPVWNDEEETPPNGWPDYPTFDAARCRAANWFVDSFLIIVRESDLAERHMSLGLAITEIAAIIIKALPGPVGEWAGTVAILRWLTRIVAILAGAIGVLEELNDYLQIAADKIEENKEELICAAYRMTSVEYLTAFFTTFFGGYISPELAAAGADTTMVDRVRKWVTPLAEALAPRVYDAFANQKIPAAYVPSFDCANCENAAPLGFEFVPAALVGAAGFVGSGASNPVATVLDTDNSSLTFDAGSPGRTGRNDHQFAARPALGEGDEWVGFGFTPDGVSNFNANNFGAGHPTDTANEFININLTANMIDGTPVHLALTDKGYPTTLEGIRVIQLDELIFTEGRTKIGLTGQSAAAGAVSIRFGTFFWIKKLSEAGGGGSGAG